MNIILKTAAGAVGISEATDNLPEGHPPGTIIIIPIGNRDAFFSVEELRAALNPAVMGTPVPEVKCDPCPKFLEPNSGMQDGFIVLTNVNGTSNPGFRDAVTGQVRVYARAEDAQLEIVEAIEEELREYRAGDRAFDELNCTYQDWVEPATLHPDGVVTTDEEDFPPVIP